MQNIEDLFFELIQVSLGTRICLSHTPRADEWGELYSMAKKQSLVGVCFAGVQRLQLQQQTPPEMLYLTWMGMAAKIQQRNEIVNRQCVHLCEHLQKEGFRTCVLKGQGTAALYRVGLSGSSSSNGSNISNGFNKATAIELLNSPTGIEPEERDLSLLRQSGDIDIWLMPKDVRTIKESRARIDELVHRRFPEEKGAFVHIGFPAFSDTEVEVHYVPTMDGCPWVDRRFRRLFEERQDACFASTNALGFSVPEPMVNVMFNLHHVKRHFITEGIGLRHVIDLFFILRSMNENCGESSRAGSDPAREKTVEIREAIKKLKMKKFAGGMLWVMNEVIGNKGSNLSPIVTNLGISPNPKLGKFILREIIQGGNFGHHDERLKGVNEMGFWKRWGKFLNVSAMRARYFPLEILWSYVFRFRIGIWRKTGIKI